MPSFPQKYGFENARKNLRPFSQIFGPGPFAGSLSQNFTPGDAFFSLTAVSVKLALLSECVPSLSTKCALPKSSKALQRVLVVPAWQGALHDNNREKIQKNLMTRFCTGRGAIIPRENRSSKNGPGKHLEVPDILLPDIRDQPRFVLKHDVAIASEVPISGKNSLAITDRFPRKETQLVDYCEKPPFLKPPHSRFPMCHQDRVYPHPLGEPYPDHGLRPSSQTWLEPPLKVLSS